MIILLNAQTFSFIQINIKVVYKTFLRGEQSLISDKSLHIRLSFKSTSLKVAMSLACTMKHSQAVLSQASSVIPSYKLTGRCKELDMPDAASDRLSAMSFTCVPFKRDSTFSAFVVEKRYPILKFISPLDNGITSYAPLLRLTCTKNS